MTQHYHGIVIAACCCIGANGASPVTGALAGGSPVVGNLAAGLGGNPATQLI